MTDETGADPESSGHRPEPVFRVVRGHPTAEELAALVVVLDRARPVPDTGPAPSSGWGAYWRGLSNAPRPGPGGWRASARNW